MKTFPKGSEWRIWDLHVHTPASVLSNGFGEDWDNYVQKLFKKAIEYNISAIGITDYYLPEGYKIIKREYLDKPEKMNALFSNDEVNAIKNIAIFSNIEFRLTKLVVGKERDLKWNRKVNYHVILSDEIDIDLIESDFISQIKIAFDASIGEGAEQRPLTKATLEELGAKLIKEHPNFSKSGSPLFVGMLNAGVDENQLISILNQHSRFKNKFLLGLPADEDLSAVNWNSQGHLTRKALIKQAHFLFSSNIQTCKFALGGNDKIAFNKEFGPIKPCLWGSDAHDFEKMFQPDDNRQTWIKSDLTFEGLKQVFYDPVSRVRIQEVNPQQKSTYQTIDKVRFIDQQKSGLFSETWLPVNPDLTTIIGGKSSGKSLLLFHIAKSINAEEVDNKVKLARSSSYTDLKDVNFEVQWSNGEISKLSDFQDEKQVTYIPQLYINHLAEEDGKNQLNELIKDILTQNQEFKDFTTRQEKEITDTNKRINDKIDKIFSLRDRFTSLMKEMNSFGSKASIEEEIKKLSEKVRELRDKSGFTLEQEINYKKFTLRKHSLTSRKDALEYISTCSEQVISSSNGRMKELLVGFRDSIFSDIEMTQDSSFLSGLMDILDGKMSRAVQEFDDEVKRKTQNIPALVAKLQQDIEATDRNLKPLMEKIKDKKVLDQTSTQLLQEEEKLKNIVEISKKIESLKTQGKESREELYQLYRDLVFSYRKYEDEVDKPNYQLESDITIAAEVEFNVSAFEQFIAAFDRRSNMSFLLGELFNDEGQLAFDLKDIAEQITSIDERIIKGENIPSAKQGVSNAELTKRLFSDCFYINYKVQYREEEIAKMSPGKRGLVLLNLMLHLSNASHPILIDQPEDNLDNRTIYDQLNEFVRKRKCKRQIIMVTHNANMVVTTDSECIIVANQAGQQANLENEKYKFEYTSGSLECSFEDDDQIGVLYKKGIRQHVCEILEGGMTAFKERELKYGLKA